MYIKADLRDLVETCNLYIPFFESKDMRDRISILYDIVNINKLLQITDNTILLSNEEIKKINDLKNLYEYCTHTG